MIIVEGIQSGLLQKYVDQNPPYEILFSYGPVGNPLPDQKHFGEPYRVVSENDKNRIYTLERAKPMLHFRGDSDYEIVDLQLSKAAALNISRRRIFFKGEATSVDVDQIGEQTLHYEWDHERSRTFVQIGTTLPPFHSASQILGEVYYSEAACMDGHMADAKDLEGRNGTFTEELASDYMNFIRWGDQYEITRGRFGNNPVYLRREEIIRHTMFDPYDIAITTWSADSSYDKICILNPRNNIGTTMTFLKYIDFENRDVMFQDGPEWMDYIYTLQFGRSVIFPKPKENHKYRWHISTFVD